MAYYDLLRDLAGDTIYSRGERIARAGDVTLTADRWNGSRHEIEATVQGQQRYRASLIIEGERLTAAGCSCPAFEYQTLCKHCVATALTAQAGEPVASAPTEPSKAEREEQLLREYLGRYESDRLVDMIIGLVADDPTAWKNWVFRAEATGRSFDKRELRKLITRAFPKRHVWEYDKVARYFEQAEAVLDVFFEHLDALPDDEAFDLETRALDRLNEVLNHGIDDSGGFRFPVEMRLGDALVERFRRLRWSAARKGQWLAQRLQSNNDVSPDIPDAFEPEPEVVECFLAACQQAFDAVDVNPDYAKRTLNLDLIRLARPLVKAAREAGDVDRQTKLLAKTADSCHDLLAIAQLHLDHGDDLTAEDWFDTAKPLATHVGDRGALVDLRNQLWLARGELDPFREAAWQRFCDRPRFVTYQRFAADMARGGLAIDDYLPEIEARLQALYPEDDSGPRLSIDLDDILNFYMDRENWDAALVWAADHKASTETLLALGQAVVRSHPNQAINLHRRALPGVIERSNNEAYRQAVDCLRVLRDVKTGGKAHAKKIHDLARELRETYRQKRNFKALVDEYFPV